MTVTAYLIAYGLLTVYAMADAYRRDWLSLCKDVPFIAVVGMGLVYHLAGGG
jgi:hypothetical protein